MKRRFLPIYGFMKKLAAITLTAGLIVGLAGSAFADPGKANTKMRFHLADHHVAVGDTVSGPVHLVTKSDHHWVPFAGATLSVRVDGTEVGTLTTDDNGDATVSYVADAEGHHVIRVVYAGDDTHRQRQRAQGLRVGTGGDDGGDSSG